MSTIQGSLLNTQTLHNQSIAPSERSALAPESTQTTASQSQLNTIMRKCLNGVLATAYAATAGLVISAVTSLFSAPMGIGTQMRKESIRFYSRHMERSYLKIPLIFKISFDFSSKPAEKFTISSSNKALKNFKSAQSMKYTLLAGIKYSLKGLACLPCAYVGLTALGIASSFQQAYRALNK